MEDVAYLLEKADLAIKHSKKKAKEPKQCKGCGDLKLYHLGYCKSCSEERRQVRLYGKIGKRWISTNGHEYCYDSEGKTVLYARHRMEEILERPLQGYELIARIDGDKTNNADDNLILVLKPGIDLTQLKCECGRHYFSPNSGPIVQTPNQDS